MSAGSAPVRRSLLEDGALRLEIDSRLLGAVETWLPLLPETSDTTVIPSALISVQQGSASTAGPPDCAPSLQLGTVSASMSADGDRMFLRGSAGGATGVIQLSDHRAEILAGRGAPAQLVSDLYSMLTISAAILLGRLGRALVHSAAVVAPGGGGWLLAGDAGSGKSTTCVNLISSAWDYISDDQVVLYRGVASDAIGVEGWPRPFHVDVGWEEGELRGRRRSMNPSEVGPGRWRRTATLSGTVFPEVVAEARTRLERLTGADALSRLVRQTPWLLADRFSSERILALLVAVAERPAFRLRLGRDGYSDRDRLLDCLQPLLDES